MVLSMRFRALPSFAAMVIGIIVADPAIAQKDEFPKTMEAARRHYEEELPLKDWSRGPVEYLMLEYERDTWDDVETDEARSEFIEWFWARRDLDSRDDGHPFQEEFYRRVAYTNERFRGFPRGWRSDRGRVWITLGRPNAGMRRTELRRYGRCSAPEGEWWTYRTNNMAFRAQMGEFHVIFVETRIGQFQICDPSMLGLGAFPTDLQTAFLFTNETSVIDTVNEFAPGSGVASTTVAIRETAAHVEPLNVPAETWGISGVAGAVLIPVELPLRALLFEPAGDGLRTTLQIEASLLGLGDAEDFRGSEEWTIDLTGADASRIGGASLRTALLVPAGTGGYSVGLRVLDPLSGTAFTWEGSVEITDSGSAISPLLIARSVTRLREGGEVGVISRAEPRLSAGDSFAAVTWVRGKAPAADSVSVTLVDSTGGEVKVEDVAATWTIGASSGPLIVQAAVPAVAAGDYIVRLSVEDGGVPVEARVRIE